MIENSSSTKEDKIDAKQASVTLTIFFGMLTAFAIFWLMMTLIVVPINKATEARIDAIKFNDSQFTDLKNDLSDLHERVNGLDQVQAHHGVEISDLQNNSGNWQCIKYKKYDDLDCKIATRIKNAILINETTECLWSENGNSGILMLNMICEDWKYVKR